MTLDELAHAARGRRAVIADSGPLYGKPKPAAFILNMPGSVLLRILPTLKLYEKPGE